MTTHYRRVCMKKVTSQLVDALVAELHKKERQQFLKENFADPWILHVRQRVFSYITISAAFMLTATVALAYSVVVVNVVMKRLKAISR